MVFYKIYIIKATIGLDNHACLALNNPSQSPPQQLLDTTNVLATLDQVNWYAIVDMLKYWGNHII